MRYFFTLLFVLTSIYVQAQSKHFQISGTLMASDVNEPLEAATVYLQRIQDSTLVAYGITDAKGNFEIEGKTADPQLNIFMSYLGYKTYAKVIEIASDPIHLQTMRLETEDNTLQEVIIKAAAPITFKKDTLEYNVKSFKTKKDANVEDVLKVLPGVEIDEDGIITVNGVEVDNVLVNGKSFFGDDPSIATKNLTKDIIKKIQIVDTKTKAQAFAGETGDQENKTINLTIEEDKNKGHFGRVSAAGGTDNRYETSGIYNRFNDTKRVSVLAGTNNINAPGFSNAELNDTFGGRGSRDYGSGSGNGIITSKNVGANYTSSPSKHKEFNADYFYARSDSDQENKTDKEIFLPDSKYYTSSVSTNLKTNQSHKANIYYETDLDSTLLLTIRPRFQANESESRYLSDEKSFNEEKVLSNQSISQINSNSESQQFSTDLGATKRIGKKGSYVRFNLGANVSNSDSDKYLKSQTNYFGDSPSDEVRNQHEDGKQSGQEISSSLRFRLPLIENKLTLDLEYDYQSNLSKSKLFTYDFDDSTNEYSDFNFDQSTDFENENIVATPEVELRYRGDKWYFRTEVGYDFIELSSKDALRPELNFSQDFTQIKLGTTLGYRVRSKMEMRLQYRLRNQAPSISQLQPYVDISNPLHIVMGNPALEMTQNHRIHARYNSTNYNKGFGFFGFVNLNVLDNNVVQKSVIDEDYVKTTTYVNVDGSYNLSMMMNASKKVKLDSISNIKFIVGLRPSLNRSVNFNNDVQYTNTVRALGPTVGAVYEISDIVEVETYYSAQFSRANYSIDSFDDNAFTIHNLRINTATYLPKGLEWRNNINFNYNSNISDGFQKSAWFWNSTLSYSVLNDTGYVTLKAYDLLNQNTNARRIVNQDYIQDSESNVLQQYFLLGFSWKFNSLGAKS
ncbi:outer membrane beta-barrel protein [Formosa haliotis]|uniref:outer membrane beta-barrel protein n=1 Tax=Formosa haliotis TaxID=1555194 RepID=UPI00082487B7|nr:outer membrane beta-barrel protein [Formosa haliotis]